MGTVLVVGHENNLRSLLMYLEGISPEDIISLSLPRAVPLAYRLDSDLKPIMRPDGKKDEATGFLNGEWLGGDSNVKTILERDDKQVYDTSVVENLEVGKGGPEVRAKSATSGDFLRRSTSLNGKKTE